MSRVTPPITDVSGGYGGVEARYDDIERLAGLFDAAGDGLRRDAWDDKLLAANGDLVESAVLSPVSFAAAEEAVLAATIGPHGLAFRAVGLEVDAVAMRSGVTILRGTDDLVHEAFEVLDYLGGRALGAALPFLVVGGAFVLLTNPAIALFLYEHRDDFGPDAQKFLQAHPELVQHLINGGGGLLDGLEGDVPLPPGVRDALLAELGLDGFHGSTNDAAGDLAGLFDDTDVDVAADPDDARQLLAKNSLEGLVDNLGKTNDGHAGEIDIVKIGTEPDVRYIVNLPGTDSVDGADDVRDAEGNLQLVAGQDTAYTRGIEQAMKDAGIPPGAPVALVGHSQGGMAAAHLAADPHFSSQYDVRHVITVGSPTAQVPHIPGHTQVLSLENTADVVPSTDGEDNPDEPNRTTVRFEDPKGTIGGNHAIDTYAEGAHAVDQSDDPSIRHELDQLRDDGFIGTDPHVSTQTFTITRHHG